MNRRTFFSAGTAAVVSAGALGWNSFPASNEELTITAIKRKLSGLDLGNLMFSGEWNAVTTLNHLAQSIEYSITGYPEHKSELFINSVGKAAFQFFAAKKRMTHGLAEPIPGAPHIDGNGSLAVAYHRLMAALEHFEQYTGELQPHFAYGVLSKAEYEAAHVMHVNNHLELVRV